MTVTTSKITRLSPVSLAQLATAGYAFSLSKSPKRQAQYKFVRTAVSTAATLAKIKEYVDTRSAGDQPFGFSDVLSNINNPEIRSKIFGSEDNSLLIQEFTFDPNATIATVYLDRLNERYLSVGIPPPLISSSYFQTISQMREDLLTEIDETLIDIDF